MTAGELDHLLNANKSTTDMPQRFLLGKDDGFIDRLKKTFTIRPPSDHFKVVVIGSDWFLVWGSHCLQALIDLGKAADTGIIVDILTVVANDETSALTIAAQLHHVREQRENSLADTLTFFMEFFRYKRSRPGAKDKAIIKELKNVLRLELNWDDAKISFWTGTKRTSVGAALVRNWSNTERVVKVLINIQRTAKVSIGREGGTCSESQSHLRRVFY